MSRWVGAAVVVAGVLLAAPACFADEKTKPNNQAGSRAGGTNARASRANAPLLGMSFGQLFQLDPSTLEMLPGRRARIGGHTFGWSFSSDRSKLVLGSQVVAELRFIDLDRMRVMVGDDLRLGRGIVAVTAWPARRRVLAVVQSPGCCRGEATAYVVDPVARRIVRRYALRASLQVFGRFGGGLVLLLSPPGSVGPSRLTVLDARGGLRSAALRRILSGQGPVQPGNRPGREARPGLAIDNARGRAYVVGGETLLAEVDLAALRVRYRALSQPVSLLGRLRDWLEPTAHADIAPTGPVRRARFLGRDVVAIAGYDAEYTGGRYRVWPSGLKLIDVRNGRVRTVDPLAEAFLVLGERLVVGTRRPGLHVYSLDGRIRFRQFGRRFPGKRAFVAFARGDRAFVTIAGRYPRAFVLDLSSGRILGQRTLPPAQFVAPGQQAPWP